MKEVRKRMATDAEETAKKGGRAAAPTPPAGTAAKAATPKKDDRGAQTEQRRRRNEERTNAGIEDGHAYPHTANVRDDPNAQQRNKDVIRRGNRRSIPLTEIGVKSIGMRKTVTGAIVIKMPGDKGREKVSQLATHISRVLDPTAVKVAAPTRTAELKLVGIDISIEKEELRQALALAAECGVAEVQVGEIGASRGSLGAAYVKCPVAEARKLAQAGKVALGWSTARVIAIPKALCHCFKCLETGHTRVTCVITVDRGHLCYRCGGSGHRARGWCQRLCTQVPPVRVDTRRPQDLRGGMRPPAPKVKRKRPIRETGDEKSQGSIAKSSSKWPGGGHGIGAIIQAPPPK
jgi:hypothetical protein